MKKRILALGLLCAVLLAGCQCSHEWQDASCASPKTCSKCGETEGLALSHIWQGANHQAPKTCALCQMTIGSPLPASFEEHGIPVTAQEDTAYTYLTSCQNNSEVKTTGQLTFSNYRIFPSDAKHEALEGYEWRAVDVTIDFTDSNAYHLGILVGQCSEDYYDIESHDASIRLVAENGSDYTEAYTVSYNGIDYEDCICSHENVGFFGWEENRNRWLTHLYYRVPVGYDGTVVGFYDGGTQWNAGTYIYDIADENSIFFRLD